MSSHITPALSREEWRRLETNGEARLPIRTTAARTALGDLALWHRGTIEIPQEELPALIAVGNAALLEIDDRKMTRDRVDHLRNLLRTVELRWPEFNIAEVRDLADALEAYLPPES